MTEYFIQRFKTCNACGGLEPKTIDNGIGRPPTIIQCGVCGGRKYVPADFVPFKDKPKNVKKT